MAQKFALTIGAKKIKYPSGQIQEFSSTTDVVLGITEYVIIPGSAGTTTDAILVTASGFQITVDNSVANLATFISATDAST